MADEPGSAPFQRRARRATTILVVGAVLFAGAGLWLWLDLRGLAQREAELEQRLGGQIDTLQQSGTTLAARDDALSRQLGDLSARQKDVNARLDTLYGARRDGLLAAEAEHLARLSAQRLALMQDPAGAMALLTAADSALRDIRDADTHAARAALAKDLAQLRDAANVDTEALYLRLAALPERVDAIAGRSAGEKASRDEPAARAAPTTPAQSWWDRLSGTLLSLVTVRRVDAPLTPMITEGERALAAQNFRLLVEQAQLAMLQRRGAIYRHSLEQADRWLARISAGEPAQRNAVRREIASLLTVGMGQPLPDLTASIAATRTLAAKLLPAGEATP